MYDEEALVRATIEVRAAIEATTTTGDNKHYMYRVLAFLSREGFTLTDELLFVARELCTTSESLPVDFNYAKKGRQMRGRKNRSSKNGKQQHKDVPVSSDSSPAGPAACA